ncbi:hypothetical protein [Pseudonocardia sp. WMMC193]|uniref:hypothetical protein n=1 Tax=Pseudonocardia sp. WMMC193 TaxID=2911965 RepID=UPI001F32877E|nr:hypothetical protein [Pseudonocardia sp. WMMC193]MCF7550497.1 hypothetical protein [Pseudonocardia sp. WMMC193]
MSRTGTQSWRVEVPRRDQAPVLLRITAHTRGVPEVRMTVGQSTRPLLMDVRLLAELVEDLRAAGRALRTAEAAGYIGQIGVERHGSPDKWAPLLTPEEIEEADQ